MKRALVRKLKKHAWVVRVLVLAVLLGVFNVVMAGLYLRNIESLVFVSNSELDTSVANSQSVQLKKERDAAAKKAAEEAAKQTAETSTGATSTQSGTVAHRDPTRIDVIANKKNPLIPLDYAPNVVAVDCAGQGSITVQIQVQSDLSALCQAALTADVPLAASSAYRSYSYQVSTYNYWVSQDGQAAADTYSARPGYSEHQTGYAIDFRVPGGATLEAFGGTAQQQWLAAHASEYGFIQRYTAENAAETGYVAESWHYRYIGRASAAAFKTSGAKSLESYWGVAGGDY